MPDVPEGSTLRNFLAEAVGCHPKRISKKYEGKAYHGRSYNGRQQYWRNTQALSDEEAMKRLDGVYALRIRFKKSREGSCGKKAKKPISRNNPINKKNETAGSSGKRPSICRSTSAPITDQSREKVPDASRPSAHMSHSMKPQSSSSRSDGPDWTPSPGPGIKQLLGFDAGTPKMLASPKTAFTNMQSPPAAAIQAPVSRVTASYIGNSSKEGPAEFTALTGTSQMNSLTICRCPLQGLTPCICSIFLFDYRHCRRHFRCAC